MTDGDDRVATRTCFVIAPIGEEGSETRRRSDQILNHLIRPVLRDRGYVALRGDEIEKSGMITSQVLDKIINDDLVIADLTGPNANVFYELAVRHALRKPFVQLMAKGQPLPFDVQGMRTIQVDHTDLDSVEQARQQLGRAIDTMEQGPDIITPMTLTLSLQDLRASSSPGETSLSQIMEILPQMMEILQDVRRDVGSGGGDTPTDSDGHRHLRALIETLTDRGVVTEQDLMGLLDGTSSSRFSRWVTDLIHRAKLLQPPAKRPAAG